jgi:oligoendopeptidase F
MFASLPDNVFDFMHWSWLQIEPYYQDLSERHIDADNVSGWLSDWSQLKALIKDRFERLIVATTVDTTDKAADERLKTFLDEIYPHSQAAEQTLKEKLLASHLEPPGFEVPLRNMRAEAEIFRQENLPLLSEAIRLSTEFDKIIGAQTVTWDGKEVTLAQLRQVYQEIDRERRERAWRMEMERNLADRGAINSLWVKCMELRSQLAENAGMPEYRAYRWKQLHRFDYTPQDCYQFHQAIAEVVVPAMKRILERRRARLAVETLRPWDLEVDPHQRPPLRPFEQITQLESCTAAIFRHVDPQLGDFFEIMRAEKLLDLENRKGKAPGGYCTEFDVTRRPFIFMNAVGVHDDVQTLLHEGGHAFHVFETAHLPYIQQKSYGSEIAEVASMSMELLSSPYLTKDQGGFYSPQQAARARIQHLESSVCFWAYMAVVDAFQHWVYENHASASDPANCDAKWGELWDRFMAGQDWSGLEEAKVTGWHRKLHIHQDPFYYIEYGLAQLGAFQVWRNAQSDPAAAVAAYRHALSLGGSAPLPQLFKAAGARFAFDAAILREAVELAETTIDNLEAIQAS